LPSAEPPACQALVDLGAPDTSDHAPSILKQRRDGVLQLARRITNEEWNRDLREE